MIEMRRVRKYQLFGVSGYYVTTIMDIKSVPSKVCFICQIQTIYLQHFKVMRISFFNIVFFAYIFFPESPAEVSVHGFKAGRRQPAPSTSEVVVIPEQ